jgi:diguanylate cyclase (GGDEF)-like protein/PAS domain S-box-containing protein
VSGASGALEVARSVVVALPEAAALLDRELAMVAYNTRYQELTGLRRRSLEAMLAGGSGPLDLVSVARGEELARACMAGRRPIHLAEVAVACVSGSDLTAYVSFVPVTGSDGEVVGVIEILRDVSDEARVQARYRELLDMARLRAENLEREVEKRTQELSAALEEVTRLSREDPLTGLLNRRSFTEMAERALRLAARHGRSVALLLCDLDHFKRVNDTAGHQSGDAVLVAASRALVGAVRGTDLVGRFGGEEFVILLSETEPDTVASTAERCRVAIATADPGTAGVAMPTACVGAALFPPHGRTLDELVSRADAALYRAKHSGRDRVVMFGPGLAETVSASQPGSRLRLLVIAPQRQVLPLARLEAEFDLTLETEVDAALELLDASAMDIVLADCPSADQGIEVLRGALRRRPEALRALVLASQDAFVEVRGTTLARVDCFLLRGEDPARVAEALRDALTRREVDRQRLFLASRDVGRLFSDRLVELDRLIDRGELRFAFQPIVDPRSGAVHAYEALCRADHPVFQDATLLFEAALQSGNLWRLGRLCRRTAAARLATLEAGHSLFINLHPAELDDPELLAGELDRAAAGRVVLEITERAAIPDFRRFRSTAAALSSAGYRLAIDDLGAGYASLSAVAILEPSYVKLDMTMVRGIDRSRHKAHLVRRIVEFGNDVGIQLVAEGVETAEEARTVVELGCHLAQGYFFGPPR